MFGPAMPVSERNSKVVYEALKGAGVGLVSALPETWLVHLIRMAEDDPDMILVRLAKEEEGVGISAGAHLAGMRSALLMQNHGFLQAVNGIVSGALLYKLPLLMLVSDPRPSRRARLVADRGGKVHPARPRRPEHPVRRALLTRRGRAHDGPGHDPRAVLPLPRGAAPDPGPHVGGASLVKRIDCLEAVYDDLAECAVVTIMGAVAVELYSLGHRANFFYLEHAMGLASSMGLGIALARPDRKVVVIDGDGSVLMNLGGVTTLARYAPPNLSHIVFDNESLLSVGGFPTATSTGSDLAGIARGAGIEGARTVTGLEEFTNAARGDVYSDRMTCLVAKVEAVGPASFHMDLHLLENRFEFARALRVGGPGAQN